MKLIYLERVTLIDLKCSIDKLHLYS